MDFNRLYSDHQVALIRARIASSPRLRSEHCAEAARIAGQIGTRQARLGAPAARSWAAPCAPCAA